MRKYTLCIPTYCEVDRRDAGRWLMEALAYPLREPRITEIIISDDGSPDANVLYEVLPKHDKIKFFPHTENVGPLGNKYRATSYASNDWVICLDSDNSLIVDYLSGLEKESLESDVVYCPSFAQPNFDYRTCPFALIGKSTFPLLWQAKWDMFWCFMNTGNQTYHRDSWLNAVHSCAGPHIACKNKNYFSLTSEECKKSYWNKVYHAADVYLANKLCLIGNMRLKMVRGMYYNHRWHKQHSAYNEGPEEKQVLPVIYSLELLDYCNNESGHEYFFRGLSAEEIVISREGVAPKILRWNKESRSFHG